MEGIILDNLDLKKRIRGEDDLSVINDNSLYTNTIPVVFIFFRLPGSCCIAQGREMFGEGSPRVTTTYADLACRSSLPNFEDQFVSITFSKLFLMTLFKI